MNKTRTIIFSALFAAITAATAQITLPLPLTPVPINLALVSVFLSGMIFKNKVGVISQMVYILSGAIGLPVFAGMQGGFAVLLGPTGGYIVSYLLVAYLCEKITGKLDGGFVNYLIACSAALPVCYIFGTLWMAVNMHIPFLAALMIGVIPFVLGDVLKIFAAAFIAYALHKRKVFNT